MNTKKLVLSIIMVSLLCSSGFATAFVTLNDIECVFKNVVEKLQLRSDMIDGSTHFLIATGNIHFMLAEFEKTAHASGSTGTSMAAEYCKIALDELDTAISFYSRARITGESIGYNPLQVELLTGASYVASSTGKFQTTENIVIEFLQNGDVLGIYQKNLENLSNIRSPLHSMNELYKKGIAPSLKDIWSLIDLVTEATVFGKKATEFGSPLLTDNCPD